MKKNRENAETKFTSPRRNYCAAPKRLRDHSPNTKRRNGFDSFEEFVFETVFRLIARQPTWLDGREALAEVFRRSKFIRPMA